MVSKRCWRSNRTLFDATSPLHTPILVSFSFDLEFTWRKLGSLSWVFTARTRFPCHRRLPMKVWKTVDASKGFYLQLITEFYFSAMRRLRTVRTVAGSAKTLLTSASPAVRQPSRSYFANVSLEKLQKEAIPCDFLKWCSLGFFRTSRFATGFTPLQPKPLDSIIDMERAKDRSPEDLASIWDDVMFLLLFLFCLILAPIIVSGCKILKCFILELFSL